jgi:plastocyanin
VITLVVVTGLVAAVLPAGAAQGPTITASNYAYAPSALTIAAGETVTFANAGGSHNFRFDDGPQLPADPAEPSEPGWATPQRRTFDQPGRYTFYCEAHPTQMTGAITVQAPGIPTPPPAPPPPPPPPGDPSEPPGELAPLEVRTLRTDGRAFCTRRGPRCRRPGVRLRIDLSRAAAVTGTLTRRPANRRFGRISLGTVPAGPRTLRFTRTAAGRRLTPGRYTLALTIESERRTLRFRVI